jgi:iron complex transport system substrate-binding protein
VRIVSLVPSATELLFAIGAGDDVVGVTHECDYPPEARELPVVTHDVLPQGLAPGAIDAAVREKTLEGDAIYGLDEEEITDLEPDLIVTQELCAVCAVTYDEVAALARRLDPPPAVIPLDPTTLGEVLGDVRTIADATGCRDEGAALIQEASDRIDAIREAVKDADPPRVVAIEWLDPVFIAGHWTPQIIEYAGGIDVLGMSGQHSEVHSWEAIAAMEPDVVVVMPCGYDAQRSLEEAEAFTEQLAGLGAQKVVAVDAAAYFSRPGPRLIDGLELMAHILHPDRVPEPPGTAVALDVLP